MAGNGESYTIFLPLRSSQSLVYAEDIADMSDSKTMCSVSDSDMSEISDTTVVDPMEFPAPLPPVDPLYYLEPPAESYLAQKRYDDFKEYKKSHPREFSLIPPPFQIEFAFKDFVNALSRAYLTARATPPFRTTPGTSAEFQAIGRQLGVRIDTSVPSKGCGQLGNSLEVKRMVLTSVVRFSEVWQDRLPDGVEMRLLFKDIVNFIHKNAKARWEDDCVKLRLEQEVFPYHDVDWKEIFEQDLEVSRWMRWKDGAM
ncbi:hypothetical protein PQX77_013384 [Marasmius sp. AFHP31]|nr:hypothetical protein PQX77_013384 [Marasmius sp. AFHP31]